MFRLRVNHCNLQNWASSGLKMSTHDTLFTEPLKGYSLKVIGSVKIIFKTAQRGSFHSNVLEEFGGIFMWIHIAGTKLSLVWSNPLRVLQLSGNAPFFSFASIMFTGDSFLNSDVSKIIFQGK